MSTNPGTLVIAQVRPYDSADTYPTTYANEAMGGYHTADSTATRDAIPALRRLEGMSCFVTDSSSLYALIGGIDNSNWALMTGLLTGLTPGQVLYGDGAGLIGQSSSMTYDFDSNVTVGDGTDEVTIGKNGVAVTSLTAGGIIKAESATGKLQIATPGTDYASATHGVSANYLARALTTTTLGNSKIYDDGTDVGFNTSIPGGYLSGYHGLAIYHSTYSGLAIANSSSRNWLLYKNVDDLRIYNQTDHDVITFQAGGKIGIGSGATSPGYKLDVDGDVNISTGYHYKINGVNLAFGDVGASPALSLTAGYIPKAASATTLSDSPIYTNGTFVEIGGNSPGVPLHIKNNNARLMLDSDGGGFSQWILGSNTYGFTIYDNNNSQIRAAFARAIDSGLSIGTTYYATAAPANGLIVQGNVGVGLTSPSEILMVYKASSPRIRIKADANGYPGLEIDEAGTRKWVLYNNTDDKLKISNNTDDVLSIDPLGKLRIIGLANSYPGLEIDEAGTRKWVIYNDNADKLIFSTNTAELMTIQQDGKVGVGTVTPGSLFEMKGIIPVLTLNDGGTKGLLTLNPGIGAFTVSTDIKLTCASASGYDVELNSGADVKLNPTGLVDFANATRNGSLGYYADEVKVKINGIECWMPCRTA